MKKSKIKPIKAVLLITLVLLTNFIQILFLSLGQVRIIDFRCDVAEIGFQRYKADVGEEINFVFDVEDYGDIYVIMGDGNTIITFNGSTFSYTYYQEGIYNATLWAVGPGGPVSEWLVLEIINDAPQFEIGYTSVDYHEATYDFEDHEIGDIPEAWDIYNNDFDFFIDDSSILFKGISLSGGIENLTIEDGEVWKIQSELTGLYYRHISLTLHFSEWGEHFLTPGQYELYFSANDSMSLLGYNPELGENEILFSGSYSYGKILTIHQPQSLELFTSFYIEDFLSEPEVVEIDWLKLVRLEKGIQIIKDEFDHGNILEMNFGNINQFCGISKDFSLQIYGTIEFWYKTIDTYVGGKIYSINENVGLIQKENKWYVYGEDITHPDFGLVPIPRNNTWHHVRFDWQGHYSGKYEDLGYELFRIAIDGYPSKIFNMPLETSGINSIIFQTNGTVYIDAIGFSWDSEYNLGDNIKTIHPEHLYENLEIKFSMVNLKESELDKLGFSYLSDNKLGDNYIYLWNFGDGNYSYDESPTHEFSNAGEYPVSLTLIDDQGAMTTVVKDFIIENKNPESSILYGLNYDVTYDFKYDISDHSPTEWITHGNIKVIDYKDEFSKVVEIDNKMGGYGTIKILDPPIGYNGSIEFWIYFTDIENDEFFFWIDKLDPSDSTILALKNSTRFGFLDGKWMYYYTYKDALNKDRYAYAEMTELTKPSNNEWVHVRFDYCWEKNIQYQGLLENQWRIYVDGNASNVYNGIGNKFIRKGLEVRAGSHIFLDSFGFTSDPEYNLGDNNPSRLETYYATWDFRFYPIGPIPFDEILGAATLGPWMFGSYNFENFAQNCSANIIPELDNHFKVLELQDNNNSDLVFASLLDNQKSKYGTLEFWLRTTDTSQGLVMALGYNVFHSGIWLGADGGWWYKNGDDYKEIINIPRMQNNSWHHLRIDFDCRNNGGYLGLEQNQFNFWVDGHISELGPFNFDYNVSNFGWNIWSTKEQGFNYSIFLDAIGASWDPAYSVGDNKYPREGIYCDTEIIFSADASDTSDDQKNLRYLWNFGDNQTAFGQTVLHSYGRVGKYKVRLITLDDNGYYDISEKYLWIDNIYPKINISRVTYGRTTFDFSDDEEGMFPEDWYKSALEFLYGNITVIVNEVDGFYKVVQISNGTGIGGIWSYNCSGIPYSLTETGDLSLPYGTIEFWIYLNDTSKSNVYFSLFEDSYLDGIFIEFNNGTWMHDNSEIIFENLWNLQNNTWNHIRIDFCCDNSMYMGLENDTFIIYGDGYASNLISMVHNNHFDILNITCIGIFTKMNNSEMTNVYVDNLGFSWDPDYNIGDNMFKNIQYEFTEGETIILDCISIDTLTDYQQLIYNWGDIYMDITNWEDFGWHFSYIFTDNNDGDELENYPIVGFVGDPLYIWDIDTYYVEVSNVLPELNIHNAKVLMNISASIFSSGLEGANFTIILKADDYEQSIIEAYYPPNSQDNWVNFSLYYISMDLSRNWTISVNQTATEGGDHIFVLNLKLANGIEISKFYNFNSINQFWNVNLNEICINSSTNLSIVPLTFEATISDPSNDKIDLSINHIINITLAVDGVSAGFYRTYTIENDPNDVECYLKVIEEDGELRATIEFIELIKDDWRDNLISGKFPVSYDFEFNIDMTTFNLFDFIDEVFNDEGIINLGHIDTNHILKANYREFQPYSQPKTLSLNYNISNNYIFDNLAPSIKIQSPTNISEDQEFNIMAYVKDFNKDNVSVSLSNGINYGTGLQYHEMVYLGESLFGFNLTYTNAGEYIIRIKATDGTKESSAIQLIQVNNQLPYAKIRFYQNETYEDQIITLEADFYDTESDINRLRYFWDFGDGFFSTELNPSHSYFKAGNYAIRLNVKDDNGGTYCAIQNLTVIEQPPEILGPFSFVGVEGQSVTLDVDIIDSVSDSFMDITWDIYKALKIYNGTFNFMNINEGDRPETSHFEYNDVQDIEYKVLDNLVGHTKVLGIIDYNSALNGYWRLKFGDSTSINGTIEFWFRSSYITANEENFFISLLDDSTDTTPINLIDNGTWVYRNIYAGNQTEISDLPRLTSNTWHHIRIDYECSNGKYLGLAENQWRIIIDGISSPNFTMQFGNSPNDDTDFLDCLQITSGTSDNLSIFCDAIGFHNDLTFYQISDNFNPILEYQDYIDTIIGKKPSLTLGDGSYLLDLTVMNDEINQAQISLEIVGVSPVVSVPSKVYSGHYGYIEISAYAWDSFVDIENLEFEWLLKTERVLIESKTLTSNFKFYCSQTEIIKGHVIVRDDTDLIASDEFFIDVFMDSNGNGKSNEYDLLFVGDPIDFDGDGLPNDYETSTTHTNETKIDSDYDGLSDGWSYGSLIGEMSVGSDPLNNDTDYDGLIDGFEWFGWSYSLITDNGYTTVNYTSSTIMSDTDGDSLSDFEEYIYKTNPRNSDTDNDGFSDFVEIFEYGTDPNIGDLDSDGLLDRVEFEIGTKYDTADTDGDGIKDGEEYYGWVFKTNPLCKDSDHDFLSDNFETYSCSYKIDGRKSVENPVVLKFGKKNIEKTASAQLSFLLTYGETTSNNSLADFHIQIYKLDSELVLFDHIYRTNGTNRYFSNYTNIKDIIESAGETYYGYYVFKVTYLDDLHGDLCLEDYTIDVIRFLDPNQDDFDNDGIVDGVETSLLVPGKNLIFHPNLLNITVDTDSTTFSSYYLEISDIGKFYNPYINFSIVSNSTLLGNGYVSIKVIQKQVDVRLPNKIIFTSNISFSASENFLKKYSVEPTSYYPYNHYGQYEIIFDIYGDNSADNFNLINVTTEMDGYREATSLDSEAWFTKPDTFDSDSDGWSDYYEIYGRGSEGTNPLAWDTDRDGIKDSRDVKPLHNILIEIKFVRGSIHNLENWYVETKNPPELQMTVEFDYLGRRVAYISPHRSCDRDQEEIKYYIVGTDEEWRDPLPYYTTARFGHTYYVDIEDDVPYFRMKFSLWDEYLGPKDDDEDVFLFSADYTHNLRARQVDVPYEFYDSSSGNWLRAEITTRALRHAETIAIYDNSSSFTGHYNHKDRMHLIELTITDDPELNSPFSYGKNVIVIPNSILISTKLNLIIQNQTALESSILSSGHFMALDRDNLGSRSSNQVESVFIIECTAVEAQEILDFALFAIINETTGELGLVNSYASTKLDDIITEMMNLNPHVLELIPFINPYENSRIGSIPVQKVERSWLADVLSAHIDAVVGFLAPYIEFAIDFVNAVIDMIQDLFEYVVSKAAEAILWLVEQIVKAAILIFIYTIWGLTLAVVVSEIGILTATMAALSVFYDIDITLTSKKLIVEGDVNLSIGYSIGHEYNSYIDDDLPTIKTYLKSDNIDFEFEFSHFSFDFDISQWATDLWDSLTEDGVLEEVAEIFNSMGAIMGICGAYYSLEGARLQISTPADAPPNILKDMFKWSVGLIIFVSTLLLSGIERELSKSTLIGLGIGFIISGIAGLVSRIFATKATVATSVEAINDSLGGIDDFFGDYGFYMSILELIFDFTPDDRANLLYQTGISIISGSIAIVVGAGALAIIRNEIMQKIISLTLGFINIGLGIICLLLACSMIED
ncbi:MAG: PKD domain-containing protein [Promethearchaeota archaeon]